MNPIAAVRERRRRRREPRAAHARQLKALYEGTVEIGRVRDLHSLLETIREVAPKGATLYLEGSQRAMSPKLIAFLRTHAVHESRDIPSGTILPQPLRVHIDATEENLDEILRLGDALAEPEVCDHLVVYRGDETLIIAYDVWDTQLHVSSSLPEEAIERFRALAR